jgi:arsenate reductase
MLCPTYQEPCMNPSPARVIFACVHNAGRSQMAAALFNDLADPRLAVALSAGTAPGPRVHPVVVDAMHEIGIDVSAARPTLLTDDLAREAALLVTMGCGDACPHVPGLARDDWPLADPKERPLEEVRGIRDDIAARVRALLDGRGWAR